MHPGDIVAGKYRVQTILGRQRGLLLEARHTEFDQRVIIRLLSPALCNDKEIEQFRREAKTLAKLDSEYVARIIDVGTHSDGSFFLVRQFLDGADLGTHIRTHGALRLEEAILYALQMMEAVQECHHHNILLRELQPSHLFLTSKRGGTPIVKVTDFGTAKLLKDPAGAVVNGEMTATVMFGMSNYSSPELVRKAGDVDTRTDVWSLGCILYEMLAAVPPFQGEMAELMLKITREEPIALSSLRPDLPREFDQIISWALAKDAGSRFSSVYAFAHALKPYSSAAGQVLIDQIGRLAHAEKSHAGASAISPTSPLAKRAPQRYEQDEATVLHQVAPYSDPINDESEFERTAFLDPNVHDSSRGSVPPPPGSLPTHGSVPPPPSSYGSQEDIRASVPPARARQGSWIDPDPVAMSGLSANATGGYPASTATGHHKKARQRKLAVWAIGAALVLVPVLVVVLVFALRTGEQPVAENIDPDTPVTISDGSGSDPDVDKGEGGASPDPDATADASAEPDDTADADEGADKPPPDKPVAAPPPPPGQFTPPGSWPPKPEPPPPPPPPPKKKKKKKKKKATSSKTSGTLVAIAIGGSCAFAVDGSPRGTSSSIRVTVPLGPHTVSCTPPGKPSRAKSVVVKGDKPGIASFKVN
jgi:eukaryotic-like serine/threonine-protein kinase